MAFDSAPTYNSDGNNSYQATVQVSDGTASDSQEITVSVTEQSTSSNASDLFISEYAEGSSNNKYLEIFNGTGQEVSLDSMLFQVLQTLQTQMELMSIGMMKFFQQIQL